MTELDEQAEGVGVVVALDGVAFAVKGPDFGHVAVSYTHLTLPTSDLV